jgi:ribonuclease HI
LESYEWKIMFSRVKTHVGIYGNELADRLATEAAGSNGTSIEFNRIPKKQQKKPSNNGETNGGHVLRPP